MKRVFFCAVLTTVLLSLANARAQEPTVITVPAPPPGNNPPGKYIIVLEFAESSAPSTQPAVTLTSAPPAEAPVEQTPVLVVTKPAVVASVPTEGCDSCGASPCCGSFRDKFWAWLCYRPLRHAGCSCSCAPCCHPPLYTYFTDHCHCGHGAPDRLPTKECDSCGHGGCFLARLRGLVHGTGCSSCR